MVSFTEIAKAIGENPEKGFSVESCIPRHQATHILQTIKGNDCIVKNPFEKIAVKVQSTKPTLPTPAPRVVLSPTKVESESESDSELPLPLPMPTVVPTPAPTKTTTPAQQQ